MTTSGSGQGTPITVVPVNQAPYDQTEELGYYPNCAVSLPRYAKLVGYDEPAMWGVVYENQARYNCDTLWTENDRMRLSNALATAQQMLEQFIGYPLCPTWVVGTLAEELHGIDRWVDQQPYRYRLVTRYPRLIQAGIRAAVYVEEDSLVTHGDQVGVVGPIAVDFTDPNEVAVYYPNSGRRIYPSKVTISGGDLTIEIPRYRMVVQDLLNTPDGGIMYDTLGDYLSAVDVVRIYNDPSKQAVMVRPSCRNNDCYGGCSECTHDACMYIRDPRIGAVDVRGASWDSQNLTWNTAVFCGTGYTITRLYYQCGLKSLDLQAEMAIVKLAHTLLATPPCACDWLSKMWDEDKSYPKVMTREMLNNPFGAGSGAWAAYVWAKAIASIRMRGFP